MPSEPRLVHIVDDVRQLEDAWAAGELTMVLVLGGQLGGWTWISPIAGFIVFAIIDYLKPPEEYTPNNKHRYGNESPPVTVR